MRRKSGLTYTDVAQRTGIPARLLAEIEYGLRLPDPEQLRWIVQALSLDANPQPALDPSGA
jgi:transcriptional regulator with XRE-family HTH domain